MTGHTAKLPPECQMAQMFADGKDGYVFFGHPQRFAVAFYVSNIPFYPEHDTRRPQGIVAHETPGNIYIYIMVCIKRWLSIMGDSVTSSANPIVSHARSEFLKQ